MAELSFTKMHGSGNDFIVIDNREQKLNNKQIINLAPELCHRRFGIGADGIIALQPSDKPSLDYTMFYRNADGSDAGMCGNGARCLALFAAEAGLGTALSFNVHDTVYQASVDPHERYVTLSFPMQVEVKEVSLGDPAQLFQLNAGTEHIVLEICRDDFEDNNKLKREGERLRYHNKFEPPGTNVNFIRGISPSDVQIKTYERGVENLTLACGTGAIAAGITWHYLQRPSSKTYMKVHAEGGILEIRFSYHPDNHYYSDIQLSGNAQFVFEGIYAL